MKCGKCGHETKDGVQFCEACGESCSQKCFACGADNIPAAKFCEQCGAAIAAVPHVPEAPPPNVAIGSHQDGTPTIHAPAVPKVPSAALARVVGAGAIVAALLALGAGAYFALRPSAQAPVSPPPTSVAVPVPAPQVPLPVVKPAEVALQPPAVIPVPAPAEPAVAPTEGTVRNPATESPPPPRLRARFGMRVRAFTTGQGLMATDVQPGGPAYRAGIRASDVLMSISGVPVSLASISGPDYLSYPIETLDVISMIEDEKPVPVVIYRGGHTLEMTVQPQMIEDGLWRRIRDEK